MLNYIKMIIMMIEFNDHDDVIIIVIMIKILSSKLNHHHDYHVQYSQYLPLTS